MLGIFVEFEHVCFVTEFEDEVVAGTSEWRETNIKLVEDAPQSPNIGSFRGWPIVHTLRWHVLTRPDKVFVLTSLRIMVDKSVSDFWLQNVVRRPKINEFNLVKFLRGVEHVFGLQISMDNSNLMNLLNALANFEECVSDD